MLARSTIKTLNTRALLVHGRLPPAIVLIPALLVGVATLLPLVYLVIRSADSGSETWHFLLRASTGMILLRSVGLALAVTTGAILIGVPLAWLTVRTDLPLKRMWTVLTVLPLVIPSYVGATVVVAALGPRGLLQQLVERPFGIQRLPEIYGFPGAALTLILLTYPYVLLTVRSALFRLDPVLEDASRGLGHSRWQTFWRVTLPQLRPAIAAGSLLVALYTLSDFGAVSLLRFDSFTQAIYLHYLASFDRTIAASLSLVLVLVSLTFLFIEVWTRGRASYYRSGAGTQRPPGVIRLHAWKWPVLVITCFVVLLALGAPISVLVYWLVKGVLQGEPLRLTWAAASSSVYVSAIAAAVAVLAALPVAVLSVRFSSGLSWAVERLAYLGFALPGIVVALALAFFGANFAPVLYQTLFLLIFAYTVLFLPQALGAMRTSLLQVSPHTEEAARSLGRGPVRVLMSVTLPLMRSGIVAGGVLVFLTTMKELPATLLLSPLGFKTLATSIWSSASEGFFARAAAPALLLIFVSSLSIAVLLRQESPRK